MAQWYVDEPGWNLVDKYLKNSVIFGRFFAHICETKRHLGGFLQGVVAGSCLAYI